MLFHGQFLFQGPHSHILMMGGGGPSDFFGSKILVQSEFFVWVYEICRDFFGLQKNTEGVFWVADKGLRDFFGYAKKSSDFFG